jgi:hypothetical protein
MILGLLSGGSWLKLTRLGDCLGSIVIVRSDAAVQWMWCVG